jgi:hypothetical protein
MPALEQRPTPDPDHVHAVEPVEIPRRLDAGTWGLFFVWVGIALAAELGWGIGLLGVGLITLAGQAARKYFGSGVEGFWLVVGILFVVGGVWEVLDVRFSAAPMVLIIAGIALLVSAMRSRDDFTTGRQL